MERPQGQYVCTSAVPTYWVEPAWARRRADAREEIRRSKSLDKLDRHPLLAGMWRGASVPLRGLGSSVRLPAVQITSFIVSGTFSRMKNPPGAHSLRNACEALECCSLLPLSPAGLLAGTLYRLVADKRARFRNPASTLAGRKAAASCRTLKFRTPPRDDLSANPGPHLAHIEQSCSRGGRFGGFLPQPNIRQEPDVRAGEGPRADPSLAGRSAEGAGWWSA